MTPREEAMRKTLILCSDILKGDLEYATKRGSWYNLLTSALSRVEAALALPAPPSEAGELVKLLLQMAENEQSFADDLSMPRCDRDEAAAEANKLRQAAERTASTWPQHDDKCPAVDSEFGNCTCGAYEKELEMARRIFAKEKNNGA